MKRGEAERAAQPSSLRRPATCPLQVMTGEVSDVPAIISSKAGLKFAGPDVDAMRAVASAYDQRSLAAFQAALKVRGGSRLHGARWGGGGAVLFGAAPARPLTQPALIATPTFPHTNKHGCAARAVQAHEPQLAGDPIVQRHLAELYDNLLGQNMVK